MLDRAWILARIPHRGNMCLLDRVARWDDASVECRAGSHRDPANPLRADGRLAAACGIEYAAQAMAVHGALLAPADTAPRQGYLTSVRDVALHVDRLDGIAGDLRIAVERLSGDDNHVLYGFGVFSGDCPLLEGRAGIVLDARARRPLFSGGAGQ